MYWNALRRSGRVFIVGSFVLLLAALLLWSGVARAATLTVSTTSDTVAADSACSLREALIRANTNTADGDILLPGECAVGIDADTDTIVLANGETYTLSISGSDNTSEQGDLDIADNAAALDVIITTTDPAGDPATIDAGGDTGIGERVLQVLSGASVQLENVVITGGSSALNGAGIYNNGSLELTNAVVSANEVTDSTFEGGGIYNLGSLTLNGSSVTANRVAGSGGAGIANRGGSLTLNDSSISNNGILGNGDGAGLLTLGGTVNMTNVTFEGNDIVGSGDGAGLYNGPDNDTIGLLILNTVGITGSVISEAGDGAGLYNDSGRITGNGITIHSNEASNGSGGGIYNRGSADNIGSITFTDATITENSASGDGGGIRNESGSLSLTDALLRLNTSASGNGGALLSGGTDEIPAQVTLDNTAIEINSASDGSGGGIFNGPSSTTDLLNGSRISEGNTALGVGSRGRGGGIFNQVGGTTSIDNSSIFGNVAQNNGGGISNAGTMTIANESIIGKSDTPNFTQDNGGGGIYTIGTLNISDSSIEGNRTSTVSDAATASGGGIHNRSNIPGQGILTLTNVRIQSNRTGNGEESQGGGIYSTGTGASLTIDTSLISDNTTGDGFSSSGGGLWLGSDTETQIISSTISGNTTGNGSNSAGAGIWSAGSLQLEHNTLSGNTTGNDVLAHGGGIYLSPSSSATIINSTLSGNATGTGETSVAGAIYVSSQDVTVLWSTITDNTATSETGGIFAGPNTSAVLRGVLLASNEVGGTANNCSAQPGTLVSAGYNLVADNTGCVDAFTDGVNNDIVGTADAPIDPLIGALADNGGPTLTHDLLDGSPAREVVPPAACVDLSETPITTDQRGSERPQGTACDIGAVEVGAVALSAVSISGPASGDIGQSYEFTAAVEPASATTPVTYLWEADEQSDVEEANGGQTSTAQSFTWNTPGTKTITVTADNGTGAPVSTSQQIIISDPNDPNDPDTSVLYLPLVTR
jgi:hypothetical protein